MILNFTKMHGLGNDFVVIDAINQAVDLSSQQIKFIADRKFGIGCDQLLLVESARSEEAEFRYRIFNADGGEVEQCGNGARCFARFVVDKGMTSSQNIKVETSSGLIILTLEDNDQVTVNMGIPDLNPASLPFKADQMSQSYELDVGNRIYPIAAVSIGNPHAVLRVDDVQLAEVLTLGAEIEQHPRFANKVNVGFMQVLSANAIKLRVFERGVGETLACGTGACAAVVPAMCRAGWKIR